MNQLPTNSLKIAELDKIIRIMAIFLICFAIGLYWFALSIEVGVPINKGVRVSYEAFEDVNDSLRSLAHEFLPLIGTAFLISGSVILYCLRKRSLLERCGRDIEQPK